MCEITEFTKKLCKEYSDFYDSNSLFFKDRTVKVDGNQCHIFEKDKKEHRNEKLEENSSTKEDSKLNNANNIPLLEIGNNLQKGGLLIVGMNPAGTDIEFYTEENWENSNNYLDFDNNQRKVFLYYKKNDTSGYLRNINLNSAAL